MTSIHMRRLGLVVHPTRPIDRALETIMAWAATHDVAVGQVQVPGQVRAVAEAADPADCDLVIALGGDGTALHALHAAAPVSRPVLPISCGSIGVLTSVTADRVQAALEAFAAGRWTPHRLPGLDIGAEGAHGAVAINDLAAVRNGPGQVVVSITVDDVLYARIAGDGLVVTTALGSSAYSMAAGGPVLAPGATGMVVTPLAPHGGSCPPLVIGDASRLTLEMERLYTGVRYELDGRPLAVAGHTVTVTQRPDYATLVELADDEPRLTGLRRRGLVLDSPRLRVGAGRMAGRDQ